MAKRIDIHFHVAGKDRDIELAKEDMALYFEPRDNQHPVTAVTNAIIDAEVTSYAHKLGLGGPLTTDVYFELMRLVLAGSEEIDGIVLLALDAVFDAGGNLDPVRTDLWVPNGYLAGRIETLNDALPETKSFLLGASVSPNRPDSLARLDEAVELGAVLNKLIPSTQHIDLAAVPSAYWQRMVDSELPLLLHVGPEYAFPEGRRHEALDHIDKMDHPLNHGVTVIAAHCACRCFAWDPDFVDKLAQKMEERNSGAVTQLWADTSAMCMMTRVETMKRVLKRIPSEYLVYGSDFPVEPSAEAFSPFAYPRMSWKTYARNVGTKNAIDRDVRVKRAVGIPDETLERAAQILRPGSAAWG